MVLARFHSLVLLAFHPSWLALCPGTDTGRAGRHLARVFEVVPTI